jgi:hypothetical protein
VPLTRTQLNRHVRLRDSRSFWLPKEKETKMRSPTSPWPAVGLLALLACSCGSVGVTQVTPAQPLRRDCVLDIYTSEAEVKRPYTVVCLLDAQTGTTAFTSKTIAAAIEKAKPEACKCGADAIIFVAGDTEGASLVGWGRGRALVKAIRYGSASSR